MKLLQQKSVNRAEKLIGQIVTGKAKDFKSAYKAWLRDLLSSSPLVGIPAMFLYFPFPLFSSLKPVRIAFTGAAIWGALLVIFFEGIFPVL